MKRLFLLAAVLAATLFAPVAFSTPTTLFASGFDPGLAETYTVEILTPERVIVGTVCDPEYGFGGVSGGGTIIGACNLVTAETRPVPDTGYYGGGSIVQLAPFNGLTFTDCQMLGISRGPGPVRANLYSFTCEEPPTAGIK